MTRFTKEEVLEGLRSHIVDMQIFAQNDTSIWAEFAMDGTPKFVVYAPGGTMVCRTLDEAAECAAKQQHVRA